MIAVSSCEKTGPSDDGLVSNLSDLKVPQGFTWESSRDINFEIKITDNRFSDQLYVVSIYDADPAVNGKVLAKGSASLNSPFLSKVYLANTVKEVFVEKIAPDNTKTVQKVAVTSAKLNINMSAPVKNTVSKLASDGQVSGLNDSPDCNTGCTQTITSNNTNLNVNNGDVVCITGSNITVGFNVNGGTVRICGTNVTVQNAAFNNNSTLIITNGAKVTFSNLNTNGAGVKVYNYGEATVNGSVSPMGVFVNENKFTSTGDFNVNSTGQFTNNGILNVGSTFNLNSTSTAVNNGSIVTAQHFQLNTNSEFINNCFLWVKGNYEHNDRAVMKNHSLVKVNQTTQVNGNNGELALYNGAMLSTANIMINHKIKGYGSTSLVKVSGSTTINGNGKVEGPVDYCDANGIETNYGQFIDGAKQACNLYIPVTNCNTEGNGSAPVTDTDGDGVNDTLDEYPNDPSKAFNNYYPGEGAGATVAFEDQWPLKGDYDMNDVVLSYNFKIVTNAQNKVVEVTGNYSLEATGGVFNNGVGIEFPVSRASVSDLTGGTLEEGQDNAVIILFTNMHNELANWNTRPNDPVSPPKDYTLKFTISNGPSLETFGLGSYNPFIWNNGVPNGRGLEVHLPGKTPTKLANTALFGTGDDNSNASANRYYVTASGLPWAITVPAKPFKYPSEGSLISSGYLKFQAWAESGGIQYPDWYSNSASGYRNNSYLYNP